MINPVRIEIALFSKPGDPAKSARFLVSRSRDFYRARIVWYGLDEGFDSDHGCGQPAFHVAGPAPIDTVRLNIPAKRVPRPAFAKRNDVGVRIEMHTRPRAGTFMAGNDIPARIFVAVAQRTLGTQLDRLKT